MKKFTLPILVIGLLLPNFVFAAWWNPLSWKVFKRSAEVRVEEKLASSTPAAKEEAKGDQQVKEIEKLKKEVETLKKQTTQPRTAPNQEPPVLSQPINTAPPNTILCNGRYWNPCPASQKFYCPAIGEAQCLVENTSKQNSASENQQLAQEIKNKTTSIESSISALTQLENKCSQSMKDSEAETKRLRGLLGGSDHYDVLQKIYTQESYQRLLTDECVAKQIGAIDRILVDVRSALRIANLPSQFSSLFSQYSDTLILKRDRLVNWQFQSR